MTRKKKVQEIWNPKTILTYFSSLGENQTLSFKHLTMKVIVLTMLFTACRFTELERVDMERSRFEHEGIYLNTRPKTSLNRTEIAVPFLNENPAICPASAIQAATLSTLTMSGIPPTQIAKFARLSPRTDTLVKHYVKANLASTFGKVIASTMNAPSEELATKRSAEDGGKACVRPERDQKHKEERRSMESGMVLRDNKRLMKPHMSVEEAKNSVEFPSRVDEPDDEMEKREPLEEQFIIRTRSQAKKEEENNKAKKTHTVVVMMASSSNKLILSNKRRNR
ncbi:uncharacterized protein MONOS_13432c1 [Monocercomonoides exilis]|uniref:uncharacterized protein n=1 Tax=Monocercomonoides exilis TaxID=2049356 RepID=UPI00355AC772|nr:hypothetical protein MONOS_13432c2 [Monocercomonoides exilis]KAH7818773.1 hypothetical protein MONOS_13432c1 [Monocercomonoides exilis]|eukprot:MONOS_13432.1-p1 / transcript=MONOS_13432.1 / gene=MONOS_13432 / organism=Monocercomonoides_exilis_PA203 / gene_product=unspecified product / transcript_product=unspecified product / location=Mono_scaffold00827:26382-27386(+) / protein_length=281 / sequence_SO=supercontig / SO=protein_coding / is_pseudo=false